MEGYLGMELPAIDICELSKSYAMIDEAAGGGTTVLYSSHNLNDLEQTADHIVVINQGQILLTCSIDELKNSIHKSQVVFAADNPAEKVISSLTGLIEVSKQGKIYSFTASGDQLAFKETLADLNPTIIEPVNLSLEDVFITYMKKEGYSYDYAI